MLGDDLPFDFDRLDSRKKEKDSTKQKEVDEKLAIAAERELNPVLRKGNEQTSKIDQNQTKKPPTQSMEWTTVLVKRAVTMIESGEKTFERAAVDRFGSIEAFEEAIRQVERYKSIKIQIKAPRIEPKYIVEAKKIENYSTSSLNQPEVKERPVEDVNKLMAKKMKAEMTGDFETVRKIEEQLNLQIKAQSKPKEKLTLLPSETYNKRKAENDMSITELLRHEKLSNSKEFDREMERGIAGNKRFKDDLDTLDEQVCIGKVNVSNTFDCRAQSVEEFRQKEYIMKECWFCTDSERFKIERGADWIVAYGNYTYLAIPKTRSLHPLHCLIVPMTHACSFLDCRGDFEDEIWEEVRNFKKCLLQLAATQDRSYVFMECVMRVGDGRRHTFIDCVPTPRGQFAEHVKGHFLKALQETDEEWSQNKKVIDTSLKSGGLRAALPRKHFPYFYADFRLDQGYAHVIENAEKFGNGDFGRDLMASLLKVSRNEWRSSRTTRSEYERFIGLFKEFDWTKDLR